MEPTIIDADGAERYEAYLGDDLAGFLDYRVVHDRLALIHTEVLPDFQGHGVGAALAQFGLDDARRRNLAVVAVCQYVRSYVARHPETQDIVVGVRPARPDPPIDAE